MNAGYPYAISSTSQNPEKAAKVLEIMVGDGVQEALAAKAAPPLNAAVWDSAAIKDNALLQQFRPGELDQQWPKTPGGLLQVEGRASIRRSRSCCSIRRRRSGPPSPGWPGGCRRPMTPR
ncbi:hypothetical protein ACFQ0B_56780 [Nonomuraea thailandensis]